MSSLSQNSINSAEEELAAALPSLKAHYIKRSWISIPKRNNELGFGGSGTVRRGTLRRGWAMKTFDVAIKQLFTKGDRDNDLHVALDLVQELQLWASLAHANVLPLLGFYLSPDLREIWVISPLARNGTVSDYLERKKPPLDTRLELAKDVTRGLEYLHSREPPICHGDIKSLNVLVDADGCAMLCDLGLARRTGVPSSQAMAKLTPAGTIRYWSPELLMPDNYPSLSSDVWAWGCVFLEIMTDLVPYHEVAMEGQLIHQITCGALPADLDEVGCPLHIRELVGQSWHQEPDKRPSMSQCLATLIGGNIKHYHRAVRRACEGQVDTNVAQLERELFEVLAPLKHLHVNADWLIFRSDSIIGVGGYGIVQRAILQRRRWLPGDTVAVKKLGALGGQERRLRMTIALIRELKIWAQLDHPNIIPLAGFHLGVQLQEAWLVSPFLTNGDIGSFLRRSSFSASARLELALDTARGLEYLHSRSPPVCHGDIKSLNILITDERRAVLCDFGLAKSMENMPSGLTTSTFNQGGSLPYESPELILAKSFRTPESDVWAWGCLLQEIFSGKGPYYWATNQGAVVKWITQDIPPALLIGFDCPDRVRRLVSHCWQYDPSARPTMKECVEALQGNTSQLRFISENLARAMALKLTRTQIKFDESAKLGSSSYGTLFRGDLLGRDSTTAPQKVAVRRLFLPASNDDYARLYEAVRKLVMEWAGLRHPNLLPLSGFFGDPLTPTDILLVYPYLPQGPLERRRGVSDYSGVARDIATGLLYLHSRNPPIVHGNLHPRNVLINEKGCAVLCDYGLATAAQNATVPLTILDTDQVVSARYWSPEVVMGGPRDASADIWSYGCILFELDIGFAPYRKVDDMATLADVMTQHHLPSTPTLLQSLSLKQHRIKNILEMCWNLNPEQRPTIGKVVEVLEGAVFRFEVTLSIREESFRCLRLSHDGAALAIALDDRIEVIRSDDGVILQRLGLPLGGSVIKMLRHSASGRYLAAATTTDGILVWDLKTCKHCETFEKRTTTGRIVDISVGDHFLASAIDNRSVQIEYFGSQKHKSRVVPLNRQIISLAIFPSSDYVAVGSAHSDMMILDAESTIVRTLGGRAFLSCLWVSADGEFLFEGGSEGVRKWDVNSLDKATTVEPIYDKPVFKLSASPNGHKVAYIDYQHRLHVGSDVPKDRSKEVGSLFTTPYKTHVDLGPVSDEGSGIAVDWSEETKEIRIHRYAPYDIPWPYRMQ